MAITKQTKTAYITQDGTEFHDEAKAQAHEALSAWAMRVGLCITESKYDVMFYQPTKWDQEMVLKTFIANAAEASALLAAVAKNK